MKLRRARQAKRGRIEIIPMIDVMFFLLATFMLASLSMQRLHSLPVNLPQGQASMMHPKVPITLTVRADSQLFINQSPVTLDTLAPILKTLRPRADSDIVVSADSAAPNGITVQAMLRARQAGAQHFLIAVKRVD